MSWDRNNLAPHALPSFLRDSLSSSSAGLNLGRHLGQFGMFPMVAGNGPNTSIGSKVQINLDFFLNDAGPKKFISVKSVGTSVISHKKVKRLGKFTH